MVSLAAALIVAKIRLRYAVPVYRTEARLLIKKEQPYGRSNDKFDDIFMGGNIQNVYNEMQILKSRPLAYKVAKQLRLQTTCYNVGNIKSTLLYRETPIGIYPIDPVDSLTSVSLQITITDNDHFKLNEKGQVYPFNQALDINGKQFRVVKLTSQVFDANNSNVYQISQTSIQNAAEGVVGGLTVGLADNFGQIVNLSYESENPQMAVDILNTLMDAYKESNIEDKRQMRISTLEFIDERLDSLKVELGLVEKDLTEFLERRKAFELGKQSELYLDKLSAESSNLLQQEIKLSTIDWLINYIKNNSWKVIVPVQLGTEEPTIQPLIVQYNQLQQERQNALASMPENNPYIQNTLNPRLNKLRNDILEALTNVRQSYRITKGSLEKQSSDLEGKLQSIPSKGRELTERERQRKIKEELYLFLLQKREETAIASASTLSDSKVVEPARAGGTPIKPDRRSIYIIAIFIGLALPAGLIVLKEYLNDKVNDRSDIERITDAPFIGEIGHSDDTGALVVTQNSRRFISEQFRIIRTNIQFMLNNVQNPVIMVTSSFSGEGKSFVSTNMGAVMALTGKKTVIIELDIRKPKIVSNLKLKKQSGITNFIVGRSTIQEIIIPVPDVDNLYVIPCGPLPPNPAEMLLDPKLAELFEYTHKHFEVVIVDTAPVGLVSDAVVIGEKADCTLFILRQGYTYKKQIALIDELYRHKKLPRLSLMLNDVEVGQGYGNYYGYGKHAYGYGAGYFQEEAKPRKSFWKRMIRTVKFW